MTFPWSPLSTHQRLASAAALLGFLAVFAGSPYSVPLDAIARDAASAPRVAPLDLAAFIRSQSNVRVIDVRDSAAFADFHIPSATHIPLAQLATAEPALDPIALYADDESTASAAWMILRARGARDVSIVAGGLDGWLRDVMEPWLQSDASPDQIRAFEETAAISRYFGGRPRRGVDPDLVARRNASLPDAGTTDRAERLRRVRRSCGVR